MATAHDSIGVVVFEPNAQLLSKLCSVARGIWGMQEVLPRKTGRELQNAADFLAVGLVIVRASQQRASEAISSTLADLYARGTQLLIIQDGATRFDRQKPMSLAGLHFLSDDAEDWQLEAVLTRCLVGYVMPDLNRPEA